MFPRLLALALLASAAHAADYGSSTAAPAVPPPQPGPAYLQLAPMLGHVGPAEARIWVKATGAAKPAVCVSERADLAEARRVTLKKAAMLMDRTRARDFWCGMNLSNARHPERSGGGKAGVAQSKDPVESPATPPVIPRGPSTAFRPAFARTELRSG